MHINSTVQKRKKVVEQAIANERLEGLKVSKESQKIARDYIAGKVTAKQAAEKIRTRYRAVDSLRRPYVNQAMGIYREPLN